MLPKLNRDPRFWVWYLQWKRRQRQENETLEENPLKEIHEAQRVYKNLRKKVLI